MSDQCKGDTAVQSIAELYVGQTFRFARRPGVAGLRMPGRSRSDSLPASRSSCSAGLVRPACRAPRWRQLPGAAAMGRPRLASYRPGGRGRPQTLSSISWHGSRTAPWAMPCRGEVARRAEPAAGRLARRPQRIGYQAAEQDFAPPSEGVAIDDPPSLLAELRFLRGV